MQLPQLRRIRWAVRAALFLGVAASVAANVLHADRNIISQTISAWPPLALLLTVELTSRIPMHKPLLAVVRVLATIAIAGIAAAAPAVAPVQFVQPASAGAAVFQAPAQAPALEAAELEELEEALEFDDAAEPLRVGGTVHGVRTPAAAPVSPAVGPAPRPRSGSRAAAATSTRAMVTEPTSPKQKPRPVFETADFVAATRAMEPNVTDEELANRLGMTVGRLRQAVRDADARRADVTA